MAAPALAALVIGGISAAFYHQITHQNTLVQHIVEDELATYQGYARLLSRMSEQHLSLVRLLQNAPQLGERSLYDQSRQHIDSIFTSIDDLEQLARRGDGHSGDNRSQLQSELLQRTREYRQTMTHAVEMTTVNLALAAETLGNVNARFTDMNRAFLEVIDSNQNQIEQDAAQSTQLRETNSRLFMALSALAAVLLLFLSSLLARYLSRDLERQTQELARLSIRAGADHSIEGSDEVARISHSIAVFDQAVTDLRDHEQALESTASELRKARDELEQRVEERTRALKENNSQLEAEVEMRRAAEERLTIYAEVVRSTGEAVVVTGPDGTIVEVNPAYEHAVGEARELLIGTKLFAQEQAPTAEMKKAYDQLWLSIRETGYWSGEILEQRSNGELYPSWALINVIHDAQGTVSNYVCVSRDITELKENEEQLKQLAFYDPLTSLPNRALFRDRLEVAIKDAERQNSMLGVMYLDLDRFKYVNDTLGHGAGDRLLVEVARRLETCVRASDTVARLGGDEFVVLLTNLNEKQDASEIAERIIANVSTSIDVASERVYVGTSIGISFFPDDGHDGTTIEKNADLAMYETKEGGRNHYRMYSPEMSGRSGGRLALSVQLDSALRNHELLLHYQPIVNSRTGEIDLVEALIRWQRADGELVAAEDFISHAEESGLIREIDTWVLEQACRDSVEWQENNEYPHQVSINLSAISIQQPTMPMTIAEILERTGARAERITLEITETAMISQPMMAQKTLAEIAKLGINLAIDDFGVSHSSLSYLARFPISCIKLDRMFTNRIGRDGTSEEIIRNVLELARALNLRVIAEGVEHSRQQDFLADAGCTWMQGFHFVEPMDHESLGGWLRDRHARGPKADA